jgi:hypothetical protein
MEKRRDHRENGKPKFSGDPLDLCVEKQMAILEKVFNGFMDNENAGI